MKSCCLFFLQNITKYMNQPWSCLAIFNYLCFFISILFLNLQGYVYPFSKKLPTILNLKWWSCWNDCFQIAFLVQTDYYLVLMIYIITYSKNMRKFYIWNIFILNMWSIRYYSNMKKKYSNFRFNVLCCTRVITNWVLPDCLIARL